MPHFLFLGFGLTKRPELRRMMENQKPAAVVCPRATGQLWRPRNTGDSRRRQPAGVGLAMAVEEYRIRVQEEERVLGGA